MGAPHAQWVLAAGRNSGFWRGRVARHTLPEQIRKFGLSLGEPTGIFTPDRALAVPTSLIEFDADELTKQLRSTGGINSSEEILKLRLFTEPTGLLEGRAETVDLGGYRMAAQAITTASHYLGSKLLTPLDVVNPSGSATPNP